MNVNEIQDVLDVTQILGENGYGAEVNFVAALVDWKNGAYVAPEPEAEAEPEPEPEPVAPPTKSKPPAKKATAKTAPPASDADPDF